MSTDAHEPEALDMNAIIRRGNESTTAQLAARLFGTPEPEGDEGGTE